MADGVAITAGSGTTILTDDTGVGGHAQVMKLAISTDGSGTLIPADATNGIDVDVTRVQGTVTIAGAVTNAGTFATQVDGAALTALQLIDDPVFADDAAFTVGTSKVQAIGGYAVAHGSAPDAADAGDAGIPLMNRHRVLFTLGGHPNIITRSVHIADADGAQTDASIAGTINTGTKVAVTAIAVTCDAANTSATAVKIGFGATSIPSDSTTGANGVLLDHDGIAPGSGVVVGNGSGLLGVGADGEELRLTCEDPVGGAVSVTFSYFTIES